MERPRPSIGYDEEGTDHQLKLQQLFETLEQEWDFIKQRPERSLTRSSKIIRTLGRLNESPRELMHSLQHRSSLSEGSSSMAWKLRTNDLAVEEILTERRAAIESGKLKGRRLFEEEDGAVAADGEVCFGREDACNGWEIGNLVQDQSEVKSVFSYEYDDYDQDENFGRKEVLSPSCLHCASYLSSSSSSLRADDENVHEGGKHEMGTFAEKRIACDIGRGGGRGRWMAIIGWVAIALVLCVVGIISWRSFCHPYNLDEDGMLIPT